MVSGTYRSSENVFIFIEVYKGEGGTDNGLVISGLRVTKCCSIVLDRGTTLSVGLGVVRFGQEL